jgi:hypothetical protein
MYHHREFDPYLIGERNQQLLRGASAAAREATAQEPQSARLAADRLRLSPQERAPSVSQGRTRRALAR